MLKGKKILLGISGSIAAFKAILLLRLMTKEGAQVKVILTPAASHFVSPLVLETLSGHAIIQDLADGSAWSNHVMLGRWADYMVIMPATCNTIAKMANGICDNALLAVYLSTTCPVLVAPAMDEDMWLHASTQANVKMLTQHGVQVVDVGNGALGSGLEGAGRVLEPDEIMEQLKTRLNHSIDLAGKVALLTAGPTYEAIDPVRFIGNHSSGLMGIELAMALRNRGAKIILVLGPTSLNVPNDIEVIKVRSALEMFEAVKERFSTADITVMAAAVADYRPTNIAANKIKKTEDELSITLTKNPDILQYCGNHKAPHQLVVGFALETENEAANAKEKLQRKNADMIVMNSLNIPHAGFGTLTNKITIFEKAGQVHDIPFDTKKNLAQQIGSLIAQRINENG